MSATNDSKQVASMYAKIWTTKTLPALYALAQGVALEALNSAKESAPWNDQTTSARRLLFAEAFQEDKAVGFFVAHGVQYGVYLELSNDRKNEILRPTVEEYGAKYLIGVRRIVGDR